MFENKDKYHEKYYFKYRCDCWIMVYIFIRNSKININQLIEYYFYYLNHVSSAVD